MTPLNLPAPTTDRDRTVSRRSEPSSRAALMGEQPNPWDLLQPQDATSRHRTFVPYSYGRRLYLHPALLGKRARGQRLIAVIVLRFRRIARPAISRSGVAEPISRYGVKRSFGRRRRLPTVLSSSLDVHEMVGVHRYKLVLLLHSSCSTP